MIVPPLLQLQSIYDKQDDGSYTVDFIAAGFPAGQDNDQLLLGVWEYAAKWNRKGAKDEPPKSAQCLHDMADDEKNDRYQITLPVLAYSVCYYALCGIYYDCNAVIDDKGSKWRNIGCT